MLQIEVLQKGLHASFGQWLEKLMLTGEVVLKNYIIKSNTKSYIILSTNANASGFCSFTNMDHLSPPSWIGSLLPSLLVQQDQNEPADRAVTPTSSVAV